MLNSITDIGQCEEKSAVLRRPSVVATLKDQKVHLEQKLVRVNAALEALEKHPEFTQCLELIQQATY